MSFVRICTLFSLLSIAGVQAATVNIQVDTSVDRTAISPYIYGTNGQDYTGVTAMRSGGNRLTGYNWENNASNAGSDWFHSSDNYLTWIMDPPPADENEPALVIADHHQRAQSRSSYTLVTLQMAGYASKDKAGEVTVGETAFSHRWVEVINQKGASFDLIPDTSDDTLYIDELLNLLVNRFGYSTNGGIQGYSLDNEPSLWFSTHPRIHPDKVEVQELIDRSISLSATIKDSDPDAEVFGPVLYGFWAYMTLQDAPDWAGNFDQNYGRFIEAYLDLMSQASQNEGRRLLDVLDVHWYPEPAGVNQGDTDPGAVERRIQAVRSLWDPNYVEDSWIGQWFSPVAIIPALQGAIDTYYPGTKLAITEYDYGAASHVSGGIAQADALGVFGRHGVYFASKWGDVSDYVRSAFELYRNYDGQGGAFGNTHVRAVTDDDALNSVYAAVSDQAPEKLHLILINKNPGQTLSVNLSIAGNDSYLSGETWYFDSDNPAIRSGAPIPSIINNQFSMNLPPHSVHHLVLLPSTGSNNPPVFNENPLQRSNAEAGVNYSGSIAGSASDTDNDPLSYSKLSGPVWLNISADGSLSGIPSDGDEGLNSFQVQVSDPNNGTDTATLNITVNIVSGVPSAPTGLTAEVNTTGKGRKKSKSVTLRWNDNSGNERSFVIDRCMESDKGKNKTCPFQELATVSENVTLYKDDLGNGVFKYRVKARNDAGESDYTNEVKI